MKHLISIQFKLLSAFLIVAFFTIVSAYVNWNEQKTVSRYNASVEHSYIRVQTLLEMKNTVSETDSKTTQILESIEGNTTQVEGNADSDKKYELLASLEELNKWKKHYSNNFESGTVTQALFLRRIDDLQNTVVDTALHYVDLQEHGAEESEKAKAYQATVLSLVELKSAIDSAVIEEIQGVEKAVEAADKAKLRANQTNSAISFLTIIIALGLGILLNTLIAGPIRRVRDAAIRMASGDFTEVTPIKSHDEINDLAEAFNEMIRKLKESTTNLNAQVTQTQEKSTALEIQITETERSKLAIMNLLEDVEEEKEKAEGILHFLESINEAVYVTDTDRKIIFVNPAAASIMGKTQEEILGTHTTEHFFFEISKGESVENDFPIKNTLLHQKPLTFPDHTFVVRKEKHIPVAGTSAPIFDENEKLTGVILVFQDITEKYDLEQMKEGFLSVAAHQLRTPLGSMRWSMELLLNGDLGKITEEAKEVVSQLYENSQRMLTLVNDLLDVSRIDQKRGLEEEKVLDIVTLLEAVSKTLSGEAEKRSVQIFIKPLGTLSPILAAEKHLYEAFENILANAIRYNKENGTVTITLEEKPSGIHIEMTDTGIGIPEADQQKMFSRFFRAPNAVLKETEGSGLGLFVVKSYLEEAGASIRFESTENIGTTFFIDFPKASLKPEQV